jgi:hypothetical protein
MSVTEQQGEQIIELLKQLNSRLTEIAKSLDAIKDEIGSIHLRAIKIENKL